MVVGEGAKLLQLRAEVLPGDGSFEVPTSLVSPELNPIQHSVQFQKGTTYAYNRLLLGVQGDTPIQGSR